MEYVAGIDIGSTQAKGIVMKEHGEIVGKAILDMDAIGSPLVICR